MSRFLFATWEGGGHVQPMLRVARELIAQGHAALVLSDACNAADAAAVGVPFQAWRSAPSRVDRSPATDPLKDWLATNPLEVIQRIVGGVMCGPACAYARDVAEAVRAFGADVVIAQELLFGAMVGAEAAGARLAVFATNVWSLPTLPKSPPFGAGLPPPRTGFDFGFYADVTRATAQAFQCGLPQLNQARAAMGLAPLGDLFDQLRAAGRILLATSRAFDFDQTLPAPYQYVGPYLEDPVWAEDWTPPPGDPARPLVLVSFSTMYQAQEPVLRRVIEALGATEVRGVVTLGPVLSPADFPAPVNVTVTAHAPHSRILPLASAVVTHAGHASTLRPLLAGAPLVCIPLGRDQADNAARVTGPGAGLRLPADASSEEIRTATLTVLTDPSYRANARTLGARIAADVAARSAERELVAFAAGDGPE
ncbi:MAG TPA: glycosyltransferase [Caulobacteraceae bacterium]|jgi:MGT family glycosyltransferase|nr:glycosyltransferase [Caulobacteraceae bacterium]